MCGNLAGTLVHEHNLAPNDSECKECHLGSNFYLYESWQFPLLVSDRIDMYMGRREMEGMKCFFTL